MKILERGSIVLIRNSLENPNMAYILGFTCADGSVNKLTLSWELSNKFSSDKLLLEKFSKELNSNYRIEKKIKILSLKNK